MINSYFERPATEKQIAADAGVIEVPRWGVAAVDGEVDVGKWSAGSPRRTGSTQSAT